MLLRTLGGLALFLLLVHPAKADGIAMDDFSFAASPMDITWSLPPTVTPQPEDIEGTTDYWVQDDVTWWWGATLPSTIIFGIPSGGAFQVAVECGTYCDGISVVTQSPLLPFIVNTDGTITFVPGTYGLLTISADAPEPGVLCLLGIGLLGLLAFRRRIGARAV